MRRSAAVRAASLCFIAIAVSSMMGLLSSMEAAEAHSGDDASVKAKYLEVANSINDIINGAYDVHMGVRFLGMFELLMNSEYGTADRHRSSVLNEIKPFVINDKLRGSSTTTETLANKLMEASRDGSSYRAAVDCLKPMLMMELSSMYMRGYDLDPINKAWILILESNADNLVREEFAALYKHYISDLPRTEKDKLDALRHVLSDQFIIQVNDNVGLVRNDDLQRLVDLFDLKRFCTYKNIMAMIEIFQKLPKLAADTHEYHEIERVVYAFLHDAIFGDLNTDAFPLLDHSEVFPFFNMILERRKRQFSANELEPFHSLLKKAMDRDSGRVFSSLMDPTYVPQLGLTWYPVDLVVHAAKIPGEEAYQFIQFLIDLHAGSSKREAEFVSHLSEAMETALRVTEDQLLLSIVPFLPNMIISTENSVDMVYWLRYRHQLITYSDAEYLNNAVIPVVLSEPVLKKVDSGALIQFVNAVVARQDLMDSHRPALVWPHWTSMEESIVTLSKKDRFGELMRSLMQVQPLTSYPKAIVITLSEHVTASNEEGKLSLSDTIGNSALKSISPEIKSKEVDDAMFAQWKAAFEWSTHYHQKKEVDGQVIIGFLKDVLRSSVVHDDTTGNLVIADLVPLSKHNTCSAIEKATFEGLTASADEVVPEEGDEEKAQKSESLAALWDLLRVMDRSSVDEADDKKNNAHVLAELHLHLQADVKLYQSRRRLLHQMAKLCQVMSADDDEDDTLKAAAADRERQEQNKLDLVIQQVVADIIGEADVFSFALHNRLLLPFIAQDSNAVKSLLLISDDKKDDFFGKFNSETNDDDDNRDGLQEENPDDALAQGLPIVFDDMIPLIASLFAKTGLDRDQVNTIVDVLLSSVLAASVDPSVTFDVSVDPESDATVSFAMVHRFIDHLIKVKLNDEASQIKTIFGEAQTTDQASVAVNGAPHSSGIIARHESCASGVLKSPYMIVPLVIAGSLLLVFTIRYVLISRQIIYGSPFFFFGNRTSSSMAVPAIYGDEQGSSATELDADISGNVCDNLDGGLEWTKIILISMSIPILLALISGSALALAISSRKERRRQLLLKRMSLPVPSFDQILASDEAYESFKEYLKRVDRVRNINFYIDALEYIERLTTYLGSIKAGDNDDDAQVVEDDVSNEGSHHMDDDAQVAEDASQSESGEASSSSSAAGDNNENYLRRVAGGFLRNYFARMDRDDSQSFSLYRNHRIDCHDLLKEIYYGHESADFTALFKRLIPILQVSSKQLYDEMSAHDFVRFCAVYHNKLSEILVPDEEDPWWVCFSPAQKDHTILSVESAPIA